MIRATRFLFLSIIKSEYKSIQCKTFRCQRYFIYSRATENHLKMLKCIFDSTLENENISDKAYEIRKDLNNELYPEIAKRMRNNIYKDLIRDGY